MFWPRNDAPVLIIMICCRLFWPRSDAPVLRSSAKKYNLLALFWRHRPSAKKYDLLPLFWHRSDGSTICCLCFGIEVMPQC